jgi:predicted RNA polymerase sigma factor
MIAESGEPLTLPDADVAQRGVRLALVLRVVYLIFNEGHTASGGPELGRTDLAAEAIRIGRLLHELLPEEPEATGLLALLLLTEARRPARTTKTGGLVALEAQDRSRWDRALIAEGTKLATGALQQGPMGEYAAQAAIAALHDAAPCYENTQWDRILSLYSVLERMTDSPVVRLNRAVALAMVEGPERALVLLDELAASGAFDRSHRLEAVRGHLLERKGDVDGARAAYVAAAAGSANVRERDYLTMRAAALGSVSPPTKGR